MGMLSVCSMELGWITSCKEPVPLERWGHDSIDLLQLMINHCHQLSNGKHDITAAVFLLNVLVI